MPAELCVFGGDLPLRQPLQSHCGGVVMPGGGSQLPPPASVCGEAARGNP